MTHFLTQLSILWTLQLRLALRNVFRQRFRTALTLAAIAFGVLGLILTGGFVHDIFAKLAEAVVRSQSGHLQVARKGFFTYGSRSPDKFIIDESELPTARLLEQTEVVQVMGRLHFTALLGNGRTDFPVVVEGIEPEKEAKLGTYVVIRTGRNLDTRNRYGLLVGEGAAVALRLKPGDAVTLLASTAEGALNSLDFEVIGVFQSFSKDYDARTVKIPLVAAQELFGIRGVNLLVVELSATRDAARVADILREALGARGLDVRTWNQLNDFYDKTVQLYERQFGVLRLIVLIMVLLSVANTVNMSLLERVGEFGTMRALGNRRASVFSLVMVEGIVLGVLGATLGVVLGVLTAIAVSAVGIPMPPPPNSNLGYVAQIQLVPSMIAGDLVIGIAAAMLAVVLPAARVSRIPIVNALGANT